MIVSIIYHTRFGNNESIADRLSEILENKGYGVLVQSINDTEPAEVPPSDLYVVCSPTHVGSLPVKLNRFLKKLTLKPDSRYAAIATHAGSDSKTAEKIAFLMESNGAVAAKKPLQLLVEDLKGPLVQSWPEELENWAETL